MWFIVLWSRMPARMPLMFRGSVPLFGLAVSMFVPMVTNLMPGLVMGKAKFWVVSKLWVMAKFWVVTLVLR